MIRSNKILAVGLFSMVLGAVCFGYVACESQAEARNPISTTIYQRGNCAQGAGTTIKKVWLAFSEASGNLTVPSDCGAAGTVLVKNGTPTYAVTSGVPAGLDEAITFGTTGFFSTAAHVSALEFTATDDVVMEAWFRSRATYTLMDTGDQIDGGVEISGNTTQINLTLSSKAGSGSTGSCLASVSSDLSDTTVWHYVRGTWNHSTLGCSLALDGGTASTGTAIDTISSTGATGCTNVGAYDNGVACTPVFDGPTGLADLRLCVGSTALTDCNLGHTTVTYRAPTYTPRGQATPTATIPLVQDTFTRANEGDIAGDTTEIGAKTWVALNGGFSFNLTSNQIRAQNQVAFWRSVVSFNSGSADSIAIEWVVGASGIGAFAQELYMFRYNPGADTLGVYNGNPASAPSLRLQTLDGSGGLNTIATVGTFGSTVATWTTGDTIRVELSGTNVTLKVNGVSLGTISTATNQTRTSVGVADAMTGSPDAYTTSVTVYPN